MEITILQKRFRRPERRSDFPAGELSGPIIIQPAVNFDVSPLGGYAWLLAKAASEAGPPYQGGAIAGRWLHWEETGEPVLLNGWQIVADSAYRDYFDLDKSEEGDPIRAPHPYPPNHEPRPLNLNRSGSRLTTTVIRDGYLWTSHHVGLDGTDGTYDGNATGQSVDRSGIQWVRLKLETSSLPGDTLTYDAHGRIYDNANPSPFWYYFPSLAVNEVGDVVFGFSGSSETDYISAFYSWRKVDGTMPEMPIMLKAGEGVFWYSDCGDYSQACLDPTDGLSFWTVQEYASHDQYPFQRWATWIGKISIAP